MAYLGAAFLIAAAACGIGFLFATGHWILGMAVVGLVMMGLGK